MPKGDLSTTRLVNPIKQSFARIRTNPVGAIAGGVGTYLLVRKFVTRNPYMLGAATLAGLLVGANVQRAMKAKKGAPTKRTVEELPSS